MVRINLRKTDAWNNKGIALTQMDLLDKAIVSFGKTGKLSHPDAWHNKGVALKRLGLPLRRQDGLEPAVKPDDLNDLVALIA